MNHRKKGKIIDKESRIQMKLKTSKSFKSTVILEKFEQKDRAFYQAFYEKALICMKILARHIFTP